MTNSRQGMRQTFRALHEVAGRRPDLTCMMQGIALRAHFGSVSFRRRGSFEHCLFLPHDPMGTASASGICDSCRTLLPGDGQARFSMWLLSPHALACFGLHSPSHRLRVWHPCTRPDRRHLKPLEAGQHTYGITPLVRSGHAVASVRRRSGCCGHHILLASEASARTLALPGSRPYAASGTSLGGRHQQLTGADKQDTTNQQASMPDGTQS